MDVHHQVCRPTISCVTSLRSPHWSSRRRRSARSHGTSMQDEELTRWESMLLSVIVHIEVLDSHEQSVEGAQST
eukprot:5124023-Prorocentrum_lima.AAC.1